MQYTNNLIHLQGLCIILIDPNYGLQKVDGYVSAHYPRVSPFPQKE